MSRLDSIFVHHHITTKGLVSGTAPAALLFAMLQRALLCSQPSHCMQMLPARAVGSSSWSRYDRVRSRILQQLQHRGRLATQLVALEQLQQQSAGCGSAAAEGCGAAGGFVLARCLFFPRVSRVAGDCVTVLAHQ